MTQPIGGREPADGNDEETSLFALGTTLLRRRREIVALGFFGGVMGLAAALLQAPTYVSTVTFIPQVSEGGASGLALAASQFGIRVPTSGGGWGPAVYVQLLSSRAILEPIALDTVVLAEEGGRRSALMDVLQVNAGTPQLRVEKAVRQLGKIVTTTEDRKLGAVKMKIETKWPSLSLTLGEQVVRRLNEFNVQWRKAQASTERQFVEGQAREAERALREAEDRMQAFLQRNRAPGGSPELAFDRDRLQRDIILRQQIYTSLVQNREEARIREVRNTPVITMLEEPRLPLANEARGAVLKGILGGLAGVFIGVVLALIAASLTRARQSSTPQTNEFFSLVRELTPRILRRDER